MGMNNVVEEAELKTEYKKGKKDERQKIIEIIKNMIITPESLETKEWNEALESLKQKLKSELQTDGDSD
ncbi:MAG: hypothetical protein ABEK36_04610 [Candidatus Aenigmatarchaeota archaeon]